MLITILEAAKKTERNPSNLKIVTLVMVPYPQSLPFNNHFLLETRDVDNMDEKDQGKFAMKGFDSKSPFGDTDMGFSQGKIRKKHNFLIKS